MKHLTALAMLCASTCFGGPVQVGSDAFSGSHVVADFLGFTVGTLVSNQLASPATQGLTFSSSMGGLYVSSAYAPFGFARHGLNRNPFFSDPVAFTLSFSSPVFRVGINQLAMCAGASCTAGDYVVTTDHGSLTLPANWPSGSFIGIEDAQGITSLTINTSYFSPGTAGGTTRLDSVWLDSPVPEPAFWTLVGLAAVFGYVGRRRLTARR
jgi:hypothetical protein